MLSKWKEGGGQGIWVGWQVRWDSNRKPLKVKGQCYLANFNGLGHIWMSAHSACKYKPRRCIVLDWLPSEAVARLIFYANNFFLNIHTHTQRTGEEETVWSSKLNNGWLLNVTQTYSVTQRYSNLFGYSMLLKLIWFFCPPYQSSHLVLAATGRHTSHSE